MWGLAHGNGGEVVRQTKGDAAVGGVQLGVEEGVDRDALQAVEDPSADRLAANETHYDVDGVLEPGRCGKGSQVETQEGHLDEELEEQIVELLGEEILQR